MRRSGCCTAGLALDWRSDELDRAAALGYAAAVERLLDITSLDRAANAVPGPVFDPTAPDRARSAQAQIRAEGWRVIDREKTVLREWWLNRMMVAEFPLREKLALFWHDHFATSFDKVLWPYQMHRQQMIFRTEGWGNTAQLAWVWQWPRSTMRRRENSASCGSTVRATLPA